MQPYVTGVLPDSSRVRAVVFYSLMLIGAGCRTTDHASSAKSLGSEPFCVGPRTLEEAKALPLDGWEKAFHDGTATLDVIPSRDRPGKEAIGRGYPRILNASFFNNVANDIWDGKTMITEGEVTRLYNRFIEVGESPSLDLFTATVTLEANSNWQKKDDKPVILLDYTKSKITDDVPANGKGFPIIKAIRDEIRLVCKTYKDGIRRRLYLGPTFLLPELLPKALKLPGKAYETSPILWFALEFQDEEL